MNIINIWILLEPLTYNFVELVWNNEWITTLITIFSAQINPFFKHECSEKVVQLIVKSTTQDCEQPGIYKEGKKIWKVIKLEDI